jgi:hypothetical protein
MVGTTNRSIDAMPSGWLVVQGFMSDELPRQLSLAGQAVFQIAIFKSLAARNATFLLAFI